jgi:hypothetical protein
MYEPKIKIISTKDCKTVEDIENLFNRELENLSGSLDGNFKYYYQIQDIKKMSIGGEEVFLIIYEK